MLPADFAVRSECKMVDWDRASVVQYQGSPNVAFNMTCGTLAPMLFASLLSQIKITFKRLKEKTFFRLFIAGSMFPD